MQRHKASFESSHRRVMHIYRETTMKTVVSQNVVESGGQRNGTPQCRQKKASFNNPASKKNYSPENDSEIRINRN